MDITSVAVGFVLGIMFCSLMAFAFFVLHPWIRAYFASCPVSLFAVLGMRLRGTPPHLLVDALITLKMRGHEVGMEQIETCYLANRAMIHDFNTLVELVEKELADKDSN
jgi:uncharacterized protein YqfA (UPF0365 family)